MRPETIWLAACLLFAETNSSYEAECMAWVMRNRADAWGQTIDRILSSKDFQGRENRKFARAWAYARGEAILPPLEEKILLLFHATVQKVFSAPKQADITNGATFFTHRKVRPKARVEFVKEVAGLSLWRER